MAKKKPSRNDWESRKFKIKKDSLPPQLWREIGGILVFALAGFLLLGAFFPQYAGSWGKAVTGALRVLFGLGIYLLPFFLAIWGFDFFIRSRRRYLSHFIGILLALLVTATFAISIGKDGGASGKLIAFYFKKWVGPIGADILILAGAVIALILITNISLVKLVSAWLAARAEKKDQKEELIREVNLKKRAETAAPPPGKYSIAAKFSEIARVFTGDDKEKRDEYLKERAVTRAASPALIQAGETITKAEEKELAKQQKATAKAAEEEEKDRAEAEAAETADEAAGKVKKKTHEELAAEERAIKKAAVESKYVSDAPPISEVKNYQLPPLSLLEEPEQPETEARTAPAIDAKIVEETLASFGVGVKVTGISIGPTITRFEVQPDVGVKISRIVSLADDIALNLAAPDVRIEAPIPGKNAVGIEVPNPLTKTVSLAEIAKTIGFLKAKHKLVMALGKDVSGTPIIANLAEMPHLLIAGATGSGKSVSLKSIIVSLLLRNHPNDTKFVLIDPKMVELSTFEGIPHLACPVITDPKLAARVLRDWVIPEMERRFEEFARSDVRNIEGYNEKIKQYDPTQAQNNNGRPEADIDFLISAMKPAAPPSQPSEPLIEETEAKVFAPKAMPYIVIIVDELADLMMTGGVDVERTICRIAQKARATGIHLIIATQRPSVDIITGTIKANIPSRIAFMVFSQIDSRTILDTPGADKLLGRGDMLFSPIGAAKPLRLQGTFLSDKETEDVVNFVRRQARPEFADEIINILEKSAPTTLKQGSDELFGQAREIIQNARFISTSYLQRKLRIGYNRAARLMDELEEAGIIGPYEGENKPRKVLSS